MIASRRNERVHLANGGGGGAQAEILSEEVPPADVEALDLHGRGPRGGEPTPLPPLDPHELVGLSFLLRQRRQHFFAVLSGADLGPYLHDLTGGVDQESVAGGHSRRA